jgi:hypothetical protein
MIRFRDTPFFSTIAMVIVSVKLPIQSPTEPTLPPATV